MVLDDKYCPLTKKIVIKVKRPLSSNNASSIAAACQRRNGRKNMKNISLFGEKKKKFIYKTFMFLIKNTKSMICICENKISCYPRTN